MRRSGARPPTIRRLADPGMRLSEYSCGITRGPLFSSRARNAVEMRPFRPVDAPACLAIFDSNVPPFFLPSERDEFAAFLAEPGGTYLVGAIDERVIACGGYWLLPHAPVAALTWGMVHREYHRQGLGRELLQHRLAALRQQPGLVAVVLQTSQHSAPFFLRAGFVVEEVRPDGYGPGLDDIRLRLPLA